jgi:hypothetical protein
MSTDPFRKFEIDQRKVVVLEMGNGNLVACLSTYKHCEMIVPLLAVASKLATALIKDLFSPHEIFDSMGRFHPFW